MKAYLVHEYGKSAKFVKGEVDNPTIKPGHAIVEVKATSLNPVDHKILTLGLGIKPREPGILHMDVAGVVAETASDVDKFAVGDKVFGCAGGLQGPAGNINGALADYMLADVDLLARKPQALSFAEAAALPLVSITAWEGLFDKANVKSGDHILIHAGAGGVGHIAIGLAKAHGAKVATTVSTAEKADIASSLGADEIIFYHDENVEKYVKRLTDGVGFDVVFDTIGGDNLDKSFAATKANGAVIGIIAHNVHDLSPMHSKGLSLHIVFMLLPMLIGKNRARHGDILNGVKKLVDQGKLKPFINEERFSFAQANEAHALFASSGHLGKIVLINEGA